MPSSNHFNQHTPLMQRFSASYVPEPNSGCWLWTGQVITSKTGDARPRIKVDGKIMIAYRVAYELLIGAIPRGKLCCHHCDVSICVNPAHLFLGSARDNAMDSLSKGRHFSQRHPEAAKEVGRRLGITNTWSKGRPNYIKLSQDDRDSICARRAKGESYMSISKDYGVTRQAIHLTCKYQAARAAIAKVQP